ncbi:hypothetical protein KJ885_02970, partial [Patescibacteria group bacterium]|nr:hypothetical protein [Patescibacteria group bacterium]
MKKYTTLSAVLALLILMGPGCITFGTNTTGIDGGVFVSPDKGKTWAQSNAVPSEKGVGNINGINIADLILDPQDNNAIYLASAGNGLFYTWDGAKSWKYVESLGGGFVNSLAIDHHDKCTLFAALQNKILKSVDCARTWNSYYYDTRSGEYVSALAVDPANSKILYAGMSGGDLLKSYDAGISWSTIHRFKNNVVRIVFYPKSTNIVFVALQNAGLWKSSNSGAKWADLKENMKGFSASNNIYDFDMTADGGTIYLTSQYGVIKSVDIGETWEGVGLLTPPGSTHIYSFAVNPNNAKEIYYSTANTFYSSFDGGANWVTKKLPTSRAGTALLVDPKNANLIYLGTRQFKK